MPRLTSLAICLALATLAAACGDESSGAANRDERSREPSTGDEPRSDDERTDERATDGGAASRDQSPRDAAAKRDALAAPSEDAGEAPSEPDDGDAGLTERDARIDDAADAGSAADGDEACDRACLLAINTSYLEALIAKDASKLATSADVRFTENGKELALTEGLWAVASKLRAYRQDWIEPARGQTSGFVVLDDMRGAVIHAFRLKVVKRQVTEIESIVARRGEATFFAPDNLKMADPVFDEPVPPAERASREELIATAELYFAGLDSGDGSKIPVDARAERNENGTVTASGARIQNVAMFSYIEEIKRRYVIVDEERGQVLAFALFEIPRGIGGSSRTLHLAEAFKVRGGKIHGILAFMVNQPLGTPSGWE